MSTFRKRFTKEELGEILNKHRLWINNDPSGERAYLSGANLYGADLSGANLYGADLSNADLEGANLYTANLKMANLKMTNLGSSNLHRADLSNADLSWANLAGANVSRAIFRCADLRGAKLNETNAAEAIDMDIPIACPEKGSFIGYKKVSGGCIVELKITKNAQRCSATTRKCRCSEAKVLSITKLDGTPANISKISSSRDKTFIYKVGKKVKVKDFDPNRWNECSTGIHFFITRQEAVEY